jgi:hypothetical protein
MNSSSEAIDPLKTRNHIPQRLESPGKIKSKQDIFVLLVNENVAILPISLACLVQMLDFIKIAWFVLIFYPMASPSAKPTK